jgi:hypothetical protein
MAVNFRKNRKEQATKKGVLLIVVSVIMILILFTFILQSEKEQLDNSNCPRSGAEAKTIVIIDTSDPLTDIQALKLNGETGSLLSQFRDTSSSSIINELGLGRQHQLSVWTMSALGKKPQNHGRICNPGEVESGDFFKDMQTGKLIRLANYEVFKKFITNLFPKDLSKMKQEKSPIIYTMDYVLTYEFGQKRKMFDKEKPNRIIIISDMLENGKKISHFRGLTSTKNIDKINLKELVIHVKYLKRDQYSKLQNLKHKKWWINYFQLSNATAIGWENW